MATSSLCWRETPMLDMDRPTRQVCIDMLMSSIFRARRMSILHTTQPTLLSRLVGLWLLVLCRLLIAHGSVCVLPIASKTHIPVLIPLTPHLLPDFNNNEQLSRFDLHNGGAQDAQLLNEKWESLALVPVNPDVTDGQYFLLSMSDNDFITQNGHLNGGKFNYSDASGFNLDSQLLAFRVTLPSGAAPGS